jgi:hypothetical protein
VLKRLSINFTKSFMNLKEYLEEQMDLKKVCTIKFTDVQGMSTEIRGHIVKMEEVSGREIIETDAGFVIGMDQMIEVNGKPAKNYC